ncbi:tRNA (adenine(22)-N(1))-methyltransferase [Halobacillus seohaensis]|uniref:tRNA (Adenine(22)-N(1))-methyltransferase n=2 Tax=Halobacillus seohaensis TaxID=447421 RepID=A0ABW2EIE1_9BACI
MNGQQLSKRLKTVARYLQKPISFADIGSDHAYLPCYVCHDNPESFAIAGELNEGPYLSAKKEVCVNELEEQIEVKLGNGLEVIDDRIAQVVIAGMGGPLIANILEEGKMSLTSVSRIVVQPNIEARAIRKWFMSNDYNLVEEAILEENGHYYEILVADKGNGRENYDENSLEKQLWLGPHLLKEKSIAFQLKWTDAKNKKLNIIKQMQQSTNPDREKIKAFEREIRWIEEVLN